MADVYMRRLSGSASVLGRRNMVSVRQGPYTAVLDLEEAEALLRHLTTAIAAARGEDAPRHRVVLQEEYELLLALARSAAHDVAENPDLCSCEDDDRCAYHRAADFNARICEGAAEVMARAGRHDVAARIRDTIPTPPPSGAEMACWEGEEL